MGAQATEPEDEAAFSAMEDVTRRFSPRRFPRDEDSGDPSVTTLKWLVAFLALVAVVMGSVLMMRFKPWARRRRRQLPCRLPCRHLPSCHPETRPKLSPIVRQRRTTACLAPVRA